MTASQMLDRSIAQWRARDGALEPVDPEDEEWLAAAAEARLRYG